MWVHGDSLDCSICLGICLKFSVKMKKNVALLKIRKNSTKEMILDRDNC